MEETTDAVKSIAGWDGIINSLCNANYNYYGNDINNKAYHAC
jgi:hypothetical protein